MAEADRQGVSPGSDVLRDLFQIAAPCLVLIDEWVARTLYLGSAPTLHTANRGLEDRQIKLGCSQPGESVATFGDALRRLTDFANHLYVDGRRRSLRMTDCCSRSLRAPSYDMS